MFREIGFPPRTLLEFQTASLRLEIEPFWMFVAHCLIPLNWPLVTPLAFSDLALALLGGTLLMGGCSGVEVLLIWILHWSLLAAIAFCWLSKLLVTALPCCSLTAWMASCIVLWIIAISGVGKYTVLTDKLPDSGDDGFEASLLLGSLLASYSDVISLWEDVAVSQSELLLELLL